MQHGQVRGILGRHAQARAAAVHAPDPAELLPASSLRRELEGLDESAQRRLGRGYAELWARTFRTLVSHLRGRPERAVALFAEEVYPFLRGDRRAARVERAGPREARLVLSDDLPSAYLAGLLEGFVALSGARAVARADGAATFTVAYRVAPADRAARAAQAMSSLRLPLLVCAALGALIGIAFGAGRGRTDLAAAALAFVGTLAAQVGANTLHELRRSPASPFAPARLPRAALQPLLATGYAVAAVCGALLVVGGAPGVLVLAGIGLLLGLAYARFRSEGLGPAVAGVTYGLLIPVGAAYALDPSILGQVWLVALAGAPLGLLAAALLLVDNLADRPLDEAGGQRTLAVRLPERQPGLVFVGLLAAALVLLAAGAWSLVSPLLAALAVVMVVPGAFLCRRVTHHARDPHALGPARLGTFALLVAAAACPILVLVGAAQ